jgi:hypothetical protein
MLTENLFFKPILICIVFFFLGSAGCKNASTINYKQDIGYDLEKPERIEELPSSLREISGITLIDSSTIACIQDENGVLFLYDILKNKIKSEKFFYENGDYEGICLTDTTIFILRSDGTLFEIADYRSDSFKVNTYPTELPGSDDEGLCYDKINNRLLIARKNKIAKEKQWKSKRAIYAFDLKAKKLNHQPVFEFDTDTIQKTITQEEISIPDNRKKGKKGKSASSHIHFASSEIAIHPITNKLFLLSAKDHLLFIINQNGIVEYIAKLDPKLFRQPEGIAFQKNGDMLITNEGHNKNSTLLQFKYR